MKKILKMSSKKLCWVLSALAITLLSHHLVIENCFGIDLSIASPLDEQAVQKYHQEQEQQLKVELLKSDQDKAKQFLTWIAKAPYSEIKKSNRVNEQLQYINACLHKVDIWLTTREGSQSTQYKLAQKYQMDLRNRDYANEQEKQIKEEYIIKATNLIQNTRTQLLTDLKENKQGQNSLQDLHDCLNNADSTIKALYQYYVFKDEETTTSDFASLKQLANRYSLAQNLDFSVHIVLAEEAYRLKNRTPLNQINAAQVKINRHQSNSLSANKPIELYIMHETNQKLADIDPAHLGFQSRAYKQRMIKYHYLEGYWNEHSNNQG